ncbi:MAG TPA: hypothetical protein VFZ33_21705 [Chitinophagaceae bacterium]
MEETVILEFKVDQAKAQKQLEKTEKALLDLKEEQKELSKAYKEGAVSQDKYVKENLRLQNSIKKENDQKRTLVKTLGAEDNSRNALRLQISKLVKEYDNLNTATEEGARSAQKLEKEISDLTGKLTKGDKAAGLFKNQIGNYPEQFAKAAESVEVAGVSVGSITSRLAAFANPATAAVGILGGLVSAYARSTQGAKDLEFAQNQLSSAVTLVTNAFAAQISSAEDGEGIFASLVSGLLSRISPELQVASQIMTKSIEDLEDLGREEISIRGDVSDRLEENQELLTKISDEQTSINDKLQATNAIEANLVNNRDQLVSILEKQLTELKLQLAFDKENESLQTSVLQLEREISKEKAQTTKKIEANNRLQDDLNAKLREQIALERGANRRAQTSDDAAILTGQGENVQEAAGRRPSEVSSLPEIIKSDRILRDISNRQIEQANREAKAREEAEAIKRAAMEQTLKTSLAIFDESTGAYQVLASADALINTYKAANLALGSFPPPFSFIAAATTIAAGLANVAQINGVQFADGGYTGNGGKYEPKGVVHGNEFVIPSETVNKYGGPQYFNKYLPGYADGGFVANQNTQPAQQALIMANTLKNLPPSVVSVVEVTRAQKRVIVRENLSKLG